MEHVSFEGGYQLWVQYSDDLDIWQGFIRMPDGSLLRSPSFKEEDEAWHAIFDRHGELIANT